MKSQTSFAPVALSKRCLHRGDGLEKGADDFAIVRMATFGRFVISGEANDISGASGICPGSTVYS